MRVSISWRQQQQQQQHSRNSVQHIVPPIYQELLRHHTMDAVRLPAVTAARRLPSWQAGKPRVSPPSGCLLHDCRRYFQTATALADHEATKPHKRRWADGS
eukprot:GHUV01058039.1.p1 GENE.GHUV01058039.1~~GHUV01058039.1.p1  ORF type:complete len:101 (-),score=23.56 GHUV01058039.1:31-333(-)